MWWLLSAGAAWALPFGAGVSGLLDLRAPFAGYEQYTVAGFPEGQGPGCGETEGGAQLDAGCDEMTEDAVLPLNLAVVAPLFVPLAPNASLRVEGRAGYSNGRVPVTCQGDDSCPYLTNGEPSLTSLRGGTYRSSRLHLPSLSVAAGPDVRLTSGNGVAPHVAAVVGAGIVGPWLDSDFFNETESIRPSFSAAGTVGLTARPGFNGWFVDLSYATTRVATGDVLEDDGELRVAPFAVNGVRLDVGLLFAD